MTAAAPLDCVLGFVRAMEAGGGADDIRPFLADDFQLVEWPHALAKGGSTRNLAQTLDGASHTKNIVADQSFEIVRTTCEGGRVVLEMNWSATILLDLPHWDAGDTIRARTTAVFEVRDGRIISQDSYDCYYTEHDPR